jgi:formate-dependent nitrite reductase membrane component NrfD
MLIYWLIVIYSGALLKWIPLGLSLVGAFMLMATNIYMYVMFKRDISKDPSFEKWVRHFPKTGKYIPILALIVNFKLIKILYSGFFGKESC